MLAQIASAEPLRELSEQNEGVQERAVASFAVRSCEGMRQQSQPFAQ